MRVMTHECKVGIYNTEYTARVYVDKITTRTPYVKWVGNTGSLDFTRGRIVDRLTLDKINAALSDGDERKAWCIIGLHIEDDHLYYTNGGQ